MARAPRRIRARIEEHLQHSSRRLPAHPQRREELGALERAGRVDGDAGIDRNLHRFDVAVARGELQQRSWPGFLVRGGGLQVWQAQREQVEVAVLGRPQEAVDRAGSAGAEEQRESAEFRRV